MFTLTRMCQTNGCNGFGPQNHIVRKRTFNRLAKLANDWAVLWVHICMGTVQLTVCYYHVTYAFQSESALYSCLNIKELLVQNRRHIWSLSDCNGIRTDNHVVRKQTIKHLHKLAKWLTCVVNTYLCGAFDCMLLSRHLCVFQSESTLYSCLNIRQLLSWNCTHNTAQSLGQFGKRVECLFKT